LKILLENYKHILGIAVFLGFIFSAIVFYNEYKFKKQESYTYYEDKGIFEGFFKQDIKKALNYLKQVPKNSFAYKRAKFLLSKYTSKEDIKNFLNDPSYLGLCAKDTYTGHLIDNKNYTKALSLATSISLENFIFPDMTLYGFESAIFVDKNLAFDFYNQISNNFPFTLYHAIASILALEYNLTLK